jgi:hypothetical protein
MRVEDIKDVVLSAAPEAQHYMVAKKGESFTVWQEYRQLDFSADDEHAEAWAFQVDHYTKLEFDPIAKAIRQALEEYPGTTYRYEVVVENDTGYIRHMFDCEGH